MRITAHGEDRAPTPPQAQPQPQAAPDANDDEGRQVRYILKYTSNGNELTNFSTNSPSQAKIYSNNLVKNNSQLRWGGTLGGLRGVVLFRVDPDTQEQELFFMGPGEAIVNQPPAEPASASRPNVANPGGRGTYALFVSNGSQVSQELEFNSYQDALRHFTPLANSSGFTGWSVKQLS